MRKLIVTFLLVVTGLFCAPAVRAQSGLGVITGRVTDASGALIPGAKVSAVNTDTGVDTNSATNAAGVYIIPQLIPGPYSVSAEAPNFKKTVRGGITLQVSDKLDIDLQLAIGQITETVNVGGGTPLLRNEDVETGEVIDNTTIQSIPLLGGQGEVRDVLSVLQLSGDVQGQGSRAGTQLSLNSGQYSNSNLRINGGRTSSIEYVVDGIPITQDIGRQLSNTVPTVEDTSELKVVTNGLGAQYGHLSGGAINLTTQGGTNDVHGSVFEFAQFGQLNANTWLNNDTNTKRPSFHQNDFGIAMGGPVFIPHLYNGQKKTFWFANYEGSRYSNGGDASLASVLTAQERTGDLSDIGTAIGDPSTPKPQLYDPYGPSSYPNQVSNPVTGDSGLYQRYNLIGGDGMHIPANELSPLVQHYLDPTVLPLPNRNPNAGSATGDNYISTPKNTKSTDVYSIRIDEVLSDKSRLFGRFTHNNGTNILAPAIGPLSGSHDTLLPDGWGLTLNFDHTFSPTLLFNARAGGNYSPYANGSFLPANFDNSSFGIDPITLSIIGSHNLPPIQGPQLECNNVNGCSGGAAGGNLGPTNQQTSTFNSTNFVYSVSMTKILNRHTLQFGYEGRRYYDNQIQSAPSVPQSQPGYRFTSNAVEQYSETNWGSQGNADGIGQFLLGLDSWALSSSPFTRALRQNYYAAYIQDDFKVSRSWTLNFGLRWETESPVTEAHNRINVWNPDAPPPFTLEPGFTFAEALSQATDSNGKPTPLTPSEISAVVTPQWAISGFSKGALQFVHTPEHPSRNATEWHPWNFSPRFGAAWQVEKNTVIRASVSTLFLPTGGNLGNFTGTGGVSYEQIAFNQPLQGQPQGQGINLAPRGSSYLCGCVEQPFSASYNSPPTSDNHTLNVQAAFNGQPGAIDAKSHMPLEFDWSFGIQHQLPHGLLIEANYTANTSHNLLAKDNPGHFPANLYQGGPGSLNAKLYSTYVPSPNGTQISAAGLSTWTGPIQSIGYLEYQYPYYGNLQIQNRNIGRSNFQAINLRLERRLANGFQGLLNYTYSKSLDDIGGPEGGQGGTNNGYGVGGKAPQDFQTIRDVYGLSTNDQPHRLTLFYLYQLPFGRGRRWMSSPSGWEGNLLEGAVGGWSVAGTFQYASGVPLVFNANNQGNPSRNPLNFNNIYGNYAPGASYNTLKNPHSKGYSGAKFDPLKNSGSGSSAVPLFDSTQFAPAAEFTPGTLPAVYAGVRQPGNWGSTDLSVTKNFPIFSQDGARYFQFRVDATNFLNHPGTPGIDTNVNDSNFGLIQLNVLYPNAERHVQLGGRFVF